MTVKQVIVGTLLGVSAVAVLIHRLPKTSMPGESLAMKSSIKHADKPARPSSKVIG